jgi:hypothetical protein
MKVQWTEKALSDLARLHDFLALVNGRAADQAIRMLSAAPANLSHNPRIGSRLGLSRLAKSAGSSYIDMKCDMKSVTQRFSFCACGTPAKIVETSRETAPERFTIWRNRQESQRRVETKSWSKIGVLTKTRFAPEHFPEKLTGFSVKKIRKSNRLEKN